MHIYSINKNNYRIYKLNNPSHYITLVTNVTSKGKPTKINEINENKSKIPPPPYTKNPNFKISDA